MSTFPYIPGIVEPTSFDRITRLSLRLDDDRSRHMHEFYHVCSDGPDVGDFPNQATKDDVVALCGHLGDRLEGLSLTMCMPELMVPRVPVLVHRIVKQCRRLVALGIEDTSCDAFRPGNLNDVDVFYLATIAHNEWIRAQPELSEGPSDSNLHTLVINKRSFVHWQVHCRRMNLIYEPEEIVPEDEHCSHNWKVTRRVPVLNGDTSDEHEACRLAGSMLDALPSLQHACVSLDNGSVDLCMRRGPGDVFSPIRASKAYLEHA
ncbi:hypothetical protein FKP32DRAFT_423342 [Trametes sanguinea]|nr:hypothetical protein FKP32DRAFT_423342 [Trametes sanguinea]